MSILRVHYRERQRLSADDLRLEQDYRLALGGRHVLAHHDWGVVRGLRLTVDAGGAHILTPGVAVDGYGREIVVTEDLPIDLAGLDQSKCWLILLHYCEDALHRCPGEPPARLRPRPVLAVSARYAEPQAAEPDFAHARAAGAAGFAPWPVVVARYGAGCLPAKDHARTRYVSHRAAQVVAPSARAFMQLGSANRRDFHHFLLSTADEGGALAKRIGIDRGGALHVWRPLHISGTAAAANLLVAKGVIMRVIAPIPAGLGAQLSIAGQVDDELRTLTTSVRAGGWSAAASADLKGSKVTLRFADGGLGSAGLLDAASGLPLSFSHGRKKLRARPPKAAAFEERPETLDALLVIKNQRPDKSGSADPCDVDRARGGNGLAHPSALRFEPAAGPQPAPQARAIYADSAALLIAGGEGDDSDASTRVSVGGAIADKYHAIISMDGARGLNIRAAPGQDGNGTLSVTGSVHLPPIGPQDPLLPELLMLAYIGGLRRAGNLTNHLTITLSHLEGPPVEGAPLSYRIALSKQPGEGYTHKRTMELITGPEGRGDLSFRTLEFPPPAAQAIPQDTIALPRERLKAPKLEVRLLMLVEIGGKPRVVESNPLLFDLNNPP